MIPGGRNNQATGDYSFAAGRQARALHAGAFVWGDSTAANIDSTAANQFRVRASGGVYLYTNSGLTTGMYLAAGGSGWNAVSVRDRKENFKLVDTRALLERLAAIEMTSWNYTAQDPAIRHIGLMADEFNALLPGLGGEGADYINSVDADGVALAAIQGLYQEVQDRDVRIAALEAELAEQQTLFQSQLAEQQAQLALLLQRLAALEQTAAPPVAVLQP